MSVLDDIASPTVMEPNLLSAYGKGQDVARVANANTLFRAQALRGNLLQQSIDPATGLPDMAKFNMLASQAGPELAPAMSDAIDQSQTHMTAQTNLAVKRNQALTDALAPLLTLPNDQIHDGAAETAQYLVNNGLIASLPGKTPQQTAMAALAKLPSDPVQLRAKIDQMVTSLRPPDQQQQLLYGKPGTVTNPDGSVGGTMTNPRTGAVTPAPGPGAPQGMTPIEESTPTQIGVTAKGAPIMGTRKQFADQAKGVVQSPLGDGRNIPIALTNPANRRLAGVVTGQDPATAAAQTETGGNSAKEFQNISQQGVQARARGAILDNLLSDTSQFSPGPGADALLKVRQIGGVLGFPVDKDATSASESFTKLVSQINAAQGAGSDARLSVAQAGNVHKDLSPQGVDLLLRQLRGNEDYNRARATLAQAYPDKSDSAGFEDKFGANLDPRAFQFARMQPGKQRNDYFDAIKDKATFKKSYIWAETHGLIGGGNAGQ